MQKKDGSLRLCLSQKSLNACIKREHYQIPVLEDVLPELAGKSVFSVLDLKDAYWQIKLDDESSYLCNFITPFGRFRFLKMPFGISSAAEVLQRKAHQVFGDISGVHIIADDMLIAAENEAEHDQIMRRVLERGIQKNIKFNFSKLKLKQPSVEYNGVIISAQGQRPDPKKVNAITEMPDPTDKEGVRRLIGMVNYLTPFIPNKAEVIAPLRALLRDDVTFHWEHEQVAAVDRIRTMLTSDPVLQIFYPSRQLRHQQVWEPAWCKTLGLWLMLLDHWLIQNHAMRKLRKSSWLLCLSSPSFTFISTGEKFSSKVTINLLNP